MEAAAGFPLFGPPIINNSTLARYAAGQLRHMKEATRQSCRAALCSRSLARLREARTTPTNDSTQRGLLPFLLVRVHPPPSPVCCRLPPDSRQVEPSEVRPAIPISSSSHAEQQSHTEQQHTSVEETAAASAISKLNASASTMDTASTTSGPQFVGEIGVKGELYIAVDKSEYHAGETVTGRITVNVSETIQCDTLVFTITGEEIAQWTERGDHHSRYQEFLKHDILVSVMPNPYLPGEYLYPFQYTLPADLPGVVDADSLYGEFKALHATIKYTLKASIKVESRFVSDLESMHSLVVREKPQEHELVSHGVERTVSKRVRFLGCISRGTCHVAASMKKNVLALGESARIDIFVNNHTSSAGIKSVKCRLYQDVALKDSSGIDKICSRPLLQVKCDGPSSGELLERPIDMILAGKMRFPSTKGSFIACSYRISLECEIFLAKTIRIDIPVTILPSQGPLRPLNIRGLSAGMQQPHIPPGAAALTHQQSGGGVVLTPASSASGSSQPFAHLAAQPPLPTIDLMA